MVAGGLWPAPLNAVEKRSLYRFADQAVVRVVIKARLGLLEQ